MTVAGFSSTGSKRPGALWGEAPGDAPLRMTRSAGARLWDDRGREYLDFVMALGAVSLGYGDAEVTSAAAAAIARGGVGSLAPVEEEQLAAELAAVMPWLERIRFLKTGAEAVAAAVRLCRAATGRDRVLGCGYHGWLDLGSRDPGVPAPVQALFGQLPFGEPDESRRRIREAGDALAAVVVEPVVDGPPNEEWLECLRAECDRSGAVLVFDEIKTGFRVAVGGAVERWGVRADLVVLGKALANGFPLAAVGGRADLMDGVERTWISSTLATEFVALAAARAALARTVAARVPEHLGRVGNALLAGFRSLEARYPGVVTAAGVPEMSYLRFADAEAGARTAVALAARGILFKRTAYNFVSLAHTAADVDRCLASLGEVLAETVPC
ncbi:MAG: aminotransferase class III-fold pyridoxal phosphate-dependent enzyme [Gemmatimonadales bacterium]